MILYNIRSKGPYEYDKFILNFLQISNEISRLNKKLSAKEKAELNAKAEEINSLFDSVTTEDNVLQDILLIREKVENIHD